MKKYLILFFLIITSAPAFTQMNPVTIILDTAITNIAKSKTFYIKNPANTPLQITNIRTLTQAFYFTQSPFTINSFDSVLVTVYFKINQNITYNDFLIFENNKLKYSIVYYGLATAKYPDTLYRFTQGLIDEPLKTALRSFTTTGYVSLGYNIARDNMFATIDDYNNDDTIECVYIGRKIKAANRTIAQDSGFNTEHTIPQSLFNEDEPMRSDLYHLYPTDNAPNNARSNYQFGIVLSNITYNVGGSKLGRDYENEIVFEQRDVHNGNVAGFIFYFTVKYGNYGGFLTPKQDGVLRLWHRADTVNAREKTRESRILALQHVHNPFIDHPEFVDRIRSIYSVIPDMARPKISASPFSIVYDTLAANDTSSYYLSVFNYGTGNLSVNAVTSSIPQFIVESFPATVPQSEMRYVKIKFKPSVINTTYTGTLTISNSDSAITVNLKGFSNSSTGINTISSEIPSQYNLYQNYPNPFNPVTKIRFDIPSFAGENGTSNMNVELKVFDMLGREVAVLLNSRLSPGAYELLWNANDVPTGTYIYRLTAGSYSQVKRMTVIK
ncbi:T9SS C-terminal target domain-containing protein [bacterium]|nr:MAG: T9SS C-terminal target domain-containing protein [bacterium]